MFTLTEAGKESFGRENGKFSSDGKCKHYIIKSITTGHHCGKTSLFTTNRFDDFAMCIEHAIEMGWGTWIPDRDSEI